MPLYFDSTGLAVDIIQFRQKNVSPLVQELVEGICVYTRENFITG